MTSLTVMIYPSARDNGLLSLTDFRSRFMIPFAGRYRIIDFAVRNALTAEPDQIFIHSEVHDDLKVYLDMHPVAQRTKVKIVPMLETQLSVAALQRAVKKHETSHYLIYCGDLPGLIDFGELFDYYVTKKKNKTVLFQLARDGKAGMAHTALITTKKNLMAVLAEAVKTRKSSPHTFEMINNMLVNRGIEKHSHSALYWPIKSVTEYYRSMMSIFADPALVQALHADPHLLSGIHTEQPARIGRYADIAGSIISQGCIVDGTVRGSILFPGVIIAEKAVVTDSIVLPYVAINRQAIVERAVIDEFTDYANSPFLYTIGEHSHIGSLAEQLRNSDYPRSLYGSVTLIGKNCLIPENANIGGACFIGSAAGPSLFERTRTLEDGLSLVPYPGLYNGEADE